MDDEVRDRLSYNPNTGVITWSKVLGNRAHPGKEAGWVQDGYRNVKVGDNVIGSHRVAWFLYHGEWPSGQIDHINGDGLDNRIDNLRCVSHSDNHKNRKIPSSNKTGVIGVSRDSRRGGWFVSVGGFRKRCKHFCDAVMLSYIKRSELGFHRNHGRKEEVDAGN